MRAYQRRTLVKKEGWPEVDGWYWCPEVCIEKRINTEKTRLGSFAGHFSLRLEFDRWKEDQRKLEARLAHACHDGRIRAPSGYGIEYWKNKGGLARIYGKCRHCNEGLSDGIKMIIHMEFSL